ncbi:MAG: histidine--tRNA ligase [Bacteroidetes bacterium]|nr:histidine--tRNA ligase [Bacteroidota bacterium]
MEKPTLPKGTRDFGPVQMNRRLKLLDTIRSVFRTYGFQPLETPAMENLSTLTGKYGEEGDQLLFRILNSGDFLKDANQEALTNGDFKKVSASISEKGLRYDLTVPFARYVVMNQHELAMPFRRYQIQPVWRADRPQKGRYREFYQCDADAVGTDSLICEAEIVQMIHLAFTKLGVKDFKIRINHRGILSALAAMAGAEGKEGQFFVALDKLDKIGTEKVLGELAERGISGPQTQKVMELIIAKPGNAVDLFNKLQEIFNDEGKRGINDLKEVYRLLGDHAGSGSLVFDLSLARGLSYYTGCIFEVTISNVAVGSVCGGGRYDNLTMAFGSKEKLSGVGISFGIDRIYDALEELGLFGTDDHYGTRVLICHFDERTRDFAFGLVTQLRSAGIACEVYPDVAKLKKQLDYANRRGLPFVLIVGEEEMTSGKLTLKDLRSGTQQTLPVELIAQTIG